MEARAPISNTYYTYDLLGNLTQVTMPRSTGTQTRTFIHDSSGRLTSATNPENGTVLYTYNSDNTLATKVDAKGQLSSYTYDFAKRVTQVQRYTGAFQPIRVKAGNSTPYVDSAGKVWAADYGYLNGTTYTTGAAVDPFIKNERVNNSGALQYRFTVPNASYSISLTFAEIAGAQVNQRRFNVVINGANYGEIDVFQLAPGANRIFVPSIPGVVAVNGGQIDIQLVPITGSPMIAAIEISQYAGAVEDTCQRTNFYYDVNPFDGSYAQYVINRPTAKQWGGTNCPAPYQRSVSQLLERVR